MKESFPHPYGTGVQFERYRGPLEPGTAVWYIESTDQELNYVPDGRRKGKDRPMLVRHSAVIAQNIGDHFVQLKLDDTGEAKWLNVFNGNEGRRMQPRK